jgi:hypothetical protein
LTRASDNSTAKSADFHTKQPFLPMFQLSKSPMLPNGQ